MASKRIFILDNASTYPPLLEFYRNCPCEVIYLNNNVGHLALWQTSAFHRFKNDYYIYTDPDVVPIDDCPSDFIEFFMGIMKKYPHIEKVGFGLKIDDLPEFYEKKKEVLDWEKKFWEVKVEENIYDAEIDTTFALYRPHANGGNWAKAFRTGFPYLARHLPWYVNSKALSDEDVYYMTHLRKGVSFWVAGEESK